MPPNRRTLSLQHEGRTPYITSHLLIGVSCILSLSTTLALQTSLPVDPTTAVMGKGDNPIHPQTPGLYGFMNKTWLPKPVLHSVAPPISEPHPIDMLIPS